MNNIRRYFLLPLIICFIIYAFFLGWKQPQKKSLCSHLDCIDMSGISSFQLKEIYTDTPQIYRALYIHDQQYLRVEALKTSSTTASSELEAAITKMKAMYEKAPAPYPGEVSDSIVCDSSFIPTFKEIYSNNSRIGLFVGYLNNRMTFGSCSQDQAVYKGALAFTYCPKKELLLRIELMAPTAYFTLHENELIQQIQTLQCEK